MDWKKRIADIENFVIPDEKADQERIKKAITNHKIRVVLEDQKLVGFIWFSISESMPFGVDYGPYGKKYAYISYVFVSTEFRAKGIGKALYENLASYCKENKIDELICDVYENNSKSVSFHEKLGFSSFVKLYSKKL